MTAPEQPLKLQRIALSKFFYLMRKEEEKNPELPYRLLNAQGFHQPAPERTAEAAKLLRDFIAGGHWNFTAADGELKSHEARDYDLDISWGGVETEPEDETHNNRIRSIKVTADGRALTLSLEGRQEHFTVWKDENGHTLLRSGGHTFGKREIAGGMPLLMLIEGQQVNPLKQNLELMLEEFPLTLSLAYEMQLEAFEHRIFTHGSFEVMDEDGGPSEFYTLLEIEFTDPQAPAQDAQRRVFLTSVLNDGAAGMDNLLYYAGRPAASFIGEYPPEALDELEDSSVYKESVRLFEESGHADGLSELDLLAFARGELPHYAYINLNDVKAAHSDE